MRGMDNDVLAIFKARAEMTAAIIKP